MISPFNLNIFIIVILITFLYSLFEFEISVYFDVIDVVFSEKMVIGGSVDFLMIFVFIYEESGLNREFRFGLCD